MIKRMKHERHSEHHTIEDNRTITKQKRNGRQQELERERQQTEK